MNLLRNLSSNTSLPSWRAINNSFTLTTNLYMMDESQLQLFITLEAVVKWYQLIIITISIFLNALVLCACASKIYISKHKLLIRFLSVSDLVYAISEVPFIVRRFNNHQWHLGATLCHLSVLPHISIVFSIFLAVFIAWDRYRCIVYPFRSEMNKYRKYTIICVLAFGAVSLHVPSILNMKVIDVYGVEDCVRDLDQSLARSWDLLNSAATLPIPFCIMMYCYLHILWKVFTRFNNLPSDSMHVIANRMRHNKQITVMLASVVTVFIVTTLPNHILIGWVNFAPKGDLQQARKTYMILYLLTSLVHMHGFINPFIYIVNDKRFKKTLKYMTKRMCTSKRQRKRKNNKNYHQKGRNEKEIPNIKVYITDYCANNGDDGIEEGGAIKMKKRRAEKRFSNSSFLTKDEYDGDEKVEQSKKISMETQHTLFSLLRQSSFKQSSFRRSCNNSTRMTRPATMKSETCV